MMINRTKRIWWSRLVAGLLCLCMVVSVLQINVPVRGAEADKPPMEIQVWHCRNGKIEGEFDEEQSKSTEDNFTEGTCTIRPQADTKNGEKFTAFSITAGQPAVTNINYVTDNMEESTATITYNAKVPFVRINLYYTGSGDVAEGRNFGDNFSNSPQIDTKREESKKIYDTSLGLHTDKTAKAVDSDNRTFDVTLESWFTGENKANVGLILDASGSMAWTAKDIDKQIVYDEKEKETLEAAGILEEDLDGDQPFWLTEENVERLLDSTKTDNSLLGYSDYSYYVYDGRNTVKEYVPLGYWDGDDTLDTLENELIGYYKFDGSFKNEVTGREDSKLIERSKMYDETKTVSLANNLVYDNDKGYKNDYLIIYQNSSTVSPKPGIARNGGTSGSNLLLDTELKSDNFTISFAVSSNTSALNVAEKTRPFSEIMYIGPIGKEYGDGDHYRIYRDAAKDKAGGFIKWDTNTAGGGKRGDDKSGNVASPITSQDGFFETANAWDLVTYVVTEGKIATYVNGNLTEATGTLKEDFFSDGSQRIIIGGPDAYSEASLLIDELRIYDRPLNAAEVKKIYDDSNVENAFIDDGEKVRVLAGLNPSLKKADNLQLKGWYYVNSTSTIEDIEQRGTAKEFRTIKIEPDKNKKYGYEIAGGEGVPEPPDKPADDSGWEKWDKDEKLKNGASKFYLKKEGSKWKLCCVFTNSGSKSLYYSYVYEKDRDTKTKAETLQEALGAFVNKLAMSSPDSKVSAVRFSTNNFDEENRDKLVMLNWTKAPTASSEIMNLKKSGGQALEGEGGEYNYLMTGGTYVATGLDAFQKKLEPNADKEGADKYLIIFTDGKDDSLKDDKEGDTTNKDLKDLAINTAGNLKRAGWTIYCVMLNRGSATLEDEEDPARLFLYDLIGTKEGDEDESEKTAEYYSRYFRNTQAGDPIEKIFTDILEEVVYDLNGYCVQDYIDPRFDLIAQLRTNDEKPDTGVDSKLICLKENGHVSIEEEDSERDISKDGLKIWVESKTDTAQKATLCWDPSKHMYYLKWEDQTIPGCSKGVESLLVWRATFTLRAKEDFIGGNAVLTNGQDKDMNYVYSATEAETTNKSSGVEDMYQTGQTPLSGASKGTFKSAPDAYPSKGFPRVTVSVGLLSGNVETKQTIYLGETVKPLEIAKALVRALKDDDEVTGDHYYWEYLERYANSEEAQGSERKYKSLEDILTALINAEEHTITIPYYYLPAVGTAENPEVTTQTGTEAHRADKLGEITYTWSWEEDYGIQEAESEKEEDGSYVTRSTATRIYHISAMYQPSGMEARKAANNGSETIKKPLISESAYKWDSEYKPAEGELQTGEVKGDDGADKNVVGTGTHTIKIVRGELALKVSAKRSFLEHWFDRLNKEKLEVQVDVERQYYGSDPGALSAIALDSAPVDLEDDEREPLFEDGGSRIRPLMVTVTKEQWNTWKGGNESSDDTVVSFYTYYNDGTKSDQMHPYSTDAPQKLPIGTYTLTLADNSLFKALKYVDPETDIKDYENHFTIGSKGDVDSADPTRQVDPTKDDDSGKIGNFDPTTDSVNNYIANQIKDPAHPEAIGFYLGTADGTAGANGEYLDDRLGMVQVDIETGSLEVSKEVTGKAGETDKEFTFTVTLYTDEERENIATEIDGDFSVEATGYLSGETFGFDKGVATFSLKDGEKVKFDNLPAGLTYTVTETDNEGYTVTTTPVPTEAGSGDVGGTVKGHPKTVRGTIAADEVEKVQFTNDRQPVTPELKLTKNLNTNGYTLTGEDLEFNFLLTPDETEDRKNPASDPVKKLVEKEASGGTGTAGAGEEGETLSVTVAAPVEGSDSTAWTGAIGNIFNGLQYTEPGVYVYRLTEVSGSVTGMEYDPTVYTVTVTVEEGTENVDGNILYGNLTARVSVSSESPAPGETGSEVVFENTYAPKQTLTVTKKLNPEKPLALTEKDRSYAFPFTVEIRDNLDHKVTNKTYTYKINGGEEKGLSLDDTGKGSLALKDDQTAVIEGLPAGYKAVVTEGRTAACYSLDSITSVSTAAETGTEKKDTTKTTEVTGSYTGQAALEGAGLSVTFTNKKSLKPVKVSLTAQKELLIGEAKQALSASQFSFTVTPSKNNPESAPEITSPVTNAADGLITFFQDAVFSEEGTYSYTIQEVDDGKSGYTYDGREFTVKVVVAEEFAPNETGESTGRLKAEITVEVKNPQEEGSGAGSVLSEDSTATPKGLDSDDSYTYSVSLGTFVNEYHTGNLTVSKTVNGIDGDQTKPFHFTVTLYNRNNEIATDVDGKYPNPDGVEFKQGIAEFQLKHDESWTATGLPAGLRYTVTEQEANTDGYGTVVTGDGTNGTGDIPQDKTATVVFTNTKPATRITLKGNKTYYVGDVPQSSLTEGQFTFELKAKGSVPMPTGAVTAADGTITATAGNKADGSFEFGEINYTQVGIYDYTITESRPTGATGQDSSLIYDETVYDVTVTVGVDSETGHYNATAVYKPQDGNGLEAAAFANFTPVKTETSPGEEKNVLPDQTITYTVTWRNPGKNAANVIVTDTLDTGVDYVSADSPGVYDAASRTVTWDLGEKQGGDSGTVALTVKVNDSAVAEVANKATVKVGNDQSAVTNEVRNPVEEPTASASLTVTKTVEGTAADEEQLFPFRVTLSDESVNGSYGDLYFQDGVADFSLKDGESVTASGLPGGTAYKVEETDSGEYTVTSEGAEGQLTAAENKVSFVNSLDAPEPAIPVGIELNIQKDLEPAETETSLPEEACEFTFEIHPADTNPDADPLKDMGPVVISVGPLDWTEDKLVDAEYTEAGTYHYEVRERFDLGKAGIIYDEEVHELTVTVEEPKAAAGERALSAKLELDGETVASPATVAFRNIYRKDQTNVILRGHKTLKDGVLEDGQFTFTLTPLDAEVERIALSGLNPVMIGEEPDEAAVTGQTEAIPTEQPESVAEQTEAAAQTGQTEAAAEQTEAATQTEQTEAAVEQTEAAVEQTDATIPTEQTEAAAEQTEAVVEQTEAAAPTGQTEAAPVEQTEAAAEQTEAAAPTEQTEAAEPAEQPEPAAQSDQGVQTDDMMMARRVSADSGSFLHEASGHGGRSFLSAASMSGRRVEKSAPVLLSEDVIVLPGDEPVSDFAQEGSADVAEAAQESGAETAEGADGTEVQTVELAAEPIEVMPVSGVEEILEPTPEKVTLPAAQVPMPADTTDGVAEATNGKSGTFDFGSILYTEPGSYHYEIREKKGDDTDRIEYTEIVYAVTVNVIRNESGELLVESVSYQIQGEEGEPKSLAEFTNRVRTGSLTVSKTVTASEESLINKKKAFAFRVSLDDREINGTYGGMKFENGIAEFSLRHGEQKTASGLPVGIRYTVEEIGDENYTTTFAGETGLIAEGVEAKAAFTNALKETTPTPMPTPETSPTPTPTATATPEPTPTATPEPKPTATPTPVPTPSATPGTGSVTVTKVNRNADTNETIVLVDAQFYAALFADSTLTQRVGDVKTIRFSGDSASAGVTFSDLAPGTYYVSETNAAGTPVSGGEYGGGVYSARYPGGQQVTIAENKGSAELSFENVFSTLPDPQHYKNVKELVITKKVVDGDGAEIDTNKVFYAGIFADAGYTQLADHVSRNIVALEMDGNSSKSATVQIMLPSEGETRFYVTEVNKKGTPVENSESFGYDVSVVGGLLSMNINSGDQSVKITNTVKEEEETESEVFEELETGDGGSGGVGSDATAAQTGDGTPVEAMLLLMALSATALLILRRRKGTMI